MKKIIPAILIGLLSLASSSVMAGVEMGATRVIYNFDAKEAALSIKNTSVTDTYLVQSWVESDSGVRSPFTVIPPLTRLGGNEEHALRIIKTGDNLPKDRESQFWLDVKPIPATDDKNTKDTLQLIVKSRLKLFYRPKDLVGNVDEAYKNIKFNTEGGKLKVTNPTAYYISFYSLQVDEREIPEAKMVPPKSSVLFNLPAGGTTPQRVKWQVIDDSGNPTKTEQKTL